MKNYFKILGLKVSKDLTDEKVKRAYIDKIYGMRDDLSKTSEIEEAYTCLKTSDLRDFCFEQLTETIEEELVTDKDAIVKGEPPRKISKWQTVTTAVSVAIAATCLIITINISNKEPNASYIEKEGTSNTLPESSILNGDLVKRINAKIAELEEQKDENTNDESNFQEKDEDTIDESNFQEKVSENEKYLSEQGLDTDRENIEAVFYIANIDRFSEEFSKELYGDRNYNIMEVKERMNNYIADVTVHNNRGGNFISLACIAYDEEDKAIINSIEEEYITLIEAYTNNTLTEEKYRTSFNKMISFYNGSGKISAKEKDYTINSLTCGAGLLAEKYWDLFSRPYANCSYVTADDFADMYSLKPGVEGTPAILNGTRFIGDLMKSDNAQCLEAGKQKVK